MRSPSHRRRHPNSPKATYRYSWTDSGRNSRGPEHHRGPTRHALPFGCAERWIRTLKEQCLWAELHDNVDELRQAVAGFVLSYNTQCLIGRLGHRTPKEAYQDATTTMAA